MLPLILLVVSVGLADSVNPSTIGPGLYLATGPAATRRLVLFTLGAFTVYCVGGLGLVVGPGRAILAAVPRPGREAAHLVELALGGLALAVAAVLWLRRDAVARRVGDEERRATRSSFLLGAVIMAVELPTAFPYFAVIAAVVGSGKGTLNQLILIVLFNLAFVTPLVGITALRAVAGPRTERSLAGLRRVLDRHTPTLVVGVTVILATALLAVGAFGLSS